MSQGTLVVMNQPAVATPSSASSVHLTRVPVDPASHDLGLPTWGPYGKVYAGCSHIADMQQGLRWDVSVFPGFYRGRIDVPAVNWDSGYAPAQAAPDLSAWSFRHELVGREVTVETWYAAIPSIADARLVAIHCRNTTNAPQTLSLHVVCGLRYPAPNPSGHDSPPQLRPARIRLPDGGVTRDARDFSAYRPARPGALEHMAADGRVWREFREDGCIDGGALTLRDAGDTLQWTLAHAGSSAWIRLRAKAAARVCWAGQELTIEANEWRWYSAPVVADTALTLEQLSTGVVDVDHLAVTAGTAPEVERVEWNPVPRQEAGPLPESVLLTYPDAPATYGLWCSEPGRLRRWHTDRLDLVMRFATHNHISAEFSYPQDEARRGLWHDLVIEPLALAAGEERTLYAVVLAGASPQVAAQQLAAASALDLPGLLARARTSTWQPAGGNAAEADGQRLMAATILTNSVFPIYTRRRYVRHIGPGKTWDSLYFWDSGFNGLGLSEVNPALAADVLHQYLMPEGDPFNPWLHHGSPVPVMTFLAHELWNRGQERARILAAYPGLRQIHRYLAGRSHGSDTARYGSGLLATWSAFYNSGGWDDYPPQVHVHAAKLADRVTPVITSCMVIRSARLLRRLAHLAGRIGDVAEYDADIARLTAAVQAHAWDAVSGWFSYVEHDAAGVPVGPLRHASGENFNQGLDGCYPLVAGICSAEQEAALVGHLGDPRELWSDVGVTTVSQRAAYFRADGYWNGTVWMPHQWFFWKTLLDLGHADLAWRIADTALRTWATEVARSGRSWEHFPIVTGRGAGWHHFGALSAPVLAWHAAYYTPGRLTGGHDLWIEDQTASSAHEIAARLLVDSPSGRQATLLACLAPGPRRATWNGAMVPAQERRPGCWEISVPTGVAGDLRIA
jgi:hypothetical protein